ncbi:MAG TPA: hypothetical protein PLO23_08515 [Alphaproteobacteria bacterium]|nr:hypothetical protein [Alphaproteobacteria bacterium]
MSTAANPAAAATDAAKAGAKKLSGFLTTLTSQVFHPRNWIRNAGILALSAVFLPAAAAMTAPGATIGTFFATAKASATGLLGTAVSAIPGAAQAGMTGISEIAQMAQGIVPKP